MFSYRGLTFCVATSADLLNAARRFRSRVVGKSGNDSVRSKEFADRYDRTAITVLALASDGRVVGTARLILNSSLGLPIQRAFLGLKGIEARDRRIGEITDMALECPCGPDGLRGATLPGTVHESSESTIAAMGLFFLLRQISERIGLLAWVTLCVQDTWTYYRRHGLPFESMLRSDSAVGDRWPTALLVADARPTVWSNQEPVPEMFEDPLPFLAA